MIVTIHDGIQLADLLRSRSYCCYEAFFDWFMFLNDHPVELVIDW